ncbi:MAG: hypothetical protein H6616_16805 [Ignavibacteria bacterium]|nr:hypothetical protein [Ignavibacteria bacterium]
MNNFGNSTVRLSALLFLLLLSAPAFSQSQPQPTSAESFSILNQSGQKVTLRLPSSGVTPYSLFLPPTAPTVGDLFFISNGSGQASWLNPGAAGQVLQINGGVPTWQTVNLLPSGSTTNSTLVWNGTSWVENTNVTMNPANGNTSIGGNLTVGGTSVTLPNGSIDNNELANSSINVAYGAGVAGDASVALGGTLNVQNTGVLAVNGTANQVSASTTAGTVTLSTPQNIHTGATPTFAGMTLTALSGSSTATEIVVSNGGQLQTRSISSLSSFSGITTNSTLTGNGLLAPVGINLANPNTWTAAQRFSNADVNGGEVDNAPIGAATPNTGRFTTLNTTGSTTLGDGAGVDNVAMNVTGGTLDIDGLTQDNSLTNVLVQDANGIVRTRSASSLAGSSGWSLTGNSGTTDGTNFLGTTDNIPFTIRVNNQRAIRIVPVTASPNIMAGYSGNVVSTTGTEGNVIAGGGANSEPNQMIDYADYGFIGGGAANTIGYSADYAVIAGGYVNEIDQEADYSFIGAGQMNEAYDRHNVVVGGYQNKAGTNDNNWTDAAYASVVGGYQNQATAYKAFVGGGLRNIASGQRSAIVGGNNNRATQSEAFVGGGKQNEAKADGATIAGGRDNVVNGSYSAIPGGRGLTLSGSNSFGFLADNSGSNNMTVSSDNVVVFGNANLWLTNNTNTPSQLRFYEKQNSTGSFPSSTDYSSFEAQSQSSSINYVLPDTAGILGDVLRVKAISGSKITLDWATPNETSTVGKLLFARKSADESISNKALQNDDHLSIALEANKTYEISGALYVKQTGGSGGNPGLDVTWTVPGGTGTGASNSTMMISYFANESKSGNSNTGADYRDQSGVGSTSAGSSFSDIGLSTNMVTVHFKGLVITGSTSGSIVLKWTPTSNSQITVYKNSYMSARIVE